MTQEFSFNLVDKPWLPCVDADGRFVELNLRQLFAQAHQLRALEGESPPVTAALHRFLLAILHRVFGPADYEEWADLWQAEQWDMDAINAYLDEWQHRFDLFDAERPFYQSATLYLESNWVSVNRLVHHLNAAYPLFNHAETSIKNSLKPVEAAAALIAAQGFSLCGTSGAFFPRKSQREAKKQAMFVDGVNARGISFLIQGKSLFETLMLNLIQYPYDQVVSHFDDDAPVWEQNDPTSPERRPLLGYLDYLTWQNRRILLRPEVDNQGETTVVQLRWEPAKRLDSSTLDSMQHHIKNKKEGFRLLHFNENRVLWRDSAALFELHRAGDDSATNFPPATFHWLKELLDEPETGLDDTNVYQCMALGMSTKPGQATVYFYRDEYIPLPLAYFQTPDLVMQLRDALERTDLLSKALYHAIQVMGMHWQIPDADNKKWGEINRNAKSAINDWVDYTGAERHYWASLDVPFQSLIVELPQDTETARANWWAQLRQSAQNAFDQAAEYTGSGPRSFKAVVRGQSYLNYRLSELFPKPETQKEKVL
ncbi:MAG: type I-E CRISPR-associated protein Cse1/CasA [Anaerolineaceae bacterium]|nr:type I-E CRISPR-associated protein Cse1/CasA [Anaerolineaceae bacterium]